MLKELRNQHRTIIQMVFSGFKNKEIAERLEMSDCTVSQIVRSPLGQAYLEGLQDKAQESTLDVRKKLVSLNKSALTVLERIMNPAEKAPHSVQFSAAKDVLDRTGYKAPDRLHVDMTMQTKTDQEIDAEINAMQQSIAKTYLQDPVKQADTQLKTSDIETVAFTDEQPQQESSTELEESTELELIYLNNEEMDSSDQLINFYENNNEDGLNSSSKNTFNSPIQQSEESISLLSKIPPNIFQIN
jgi:predicted transcriptional regulator